MEFASTKANLLTRVHEEGLWGEAIKIRDTFEVVPRSSDRKKQLHQQLLYQLQLFEKVATPNILVKVWQKAQGRKKPSLI